MANKAYILGQQILQKLCRIRLNRLFMQISREMYSQTYANNMIINLVKASGNNFIHRTKFLFYTKSISETKQKRGRVEGRQS